jgi:Antibiotic biosynthesis monooxygenase
MVFTGTSGGPTSSAIVSTTARATSGSVGSATSRPTPSGSSFSLLSLRSTPTTVKPRSARISAVARPSSPPAPATIARRPSLLMLSSSLVTVVCQRRGSGRRLTLPRPRGRRKPLEAYRAEELAEMSRDLFTDRNGFAGARRAFVTKRNPSSTPHTRSSEGCLDFVQAADPLDPHRINIYERWTSDEDLHQFRNSGGPDLDLPELCSMDVQKYRIVAVEEP